MSSFTTALQRNLLFFAGLVLLITLLRLPSLEEPFDNDSSAVAYSARQIIHGEPLYGSHHPGHHMPGVYYTYALAFLLFGDSSFSVKLILIPWTIATALMVYAIANKLQGNRAGMISAIIFGVLSSHVYLKGTTAEPEMFAMLPYTAAVYLAVLQVQRRAGFKGFYWVGVVGAIAFMYKLVFLAPMAVAVGMIGLEFILNRKEHAALRNFLLRFLGLGAGFIALSFLVLSYFAFQGLLGRFALVFMLGTRYVGLTTNYPWFNILLMPIYILAINNVFVLVFSIAGVQRLLRSARWDSDQVRSFNIPALGVAVWFILSVLTAGITRVDYPHYTLIVVPVVAFFAGLEISRMWFILVENKSTVKEKMPGLLMVLGLVGLMFFYSGLINIHAYRHYWLYRTGQESYADFVLKGTFDGQASTRSFVLADYIVSHTDPDDLIYYWGEYPNIYYLSNRNAPIDMLWANQPELTGSYMRIFTTQTRYIIVANSIIMDEPGWMQVELDKAYRLETVIDEQRIYSRILK
jgi:4-amino-4-deoxy-L-arabinose transferase-like glycosyltransferase